jgi:hypothetical protein
MKLKHSFWQSIIRDILLIVSCFVIAFACAFGAIVLLGLLRDALSKEKPGMDKAPSGVVVLLEGNNMERIYTSGGDGEVLLYLVWVNEELVTIS